MISSYCIVVNTRLYFSCQQSICSNASTSLLTSLMCFSKNWSVVCIRNFWCLWLRLTSQVSASNPPSVYYKSDLLLRNGPLYSRKMYILTKVTSWSYHWAPQTGYQYAETQTVLTCWHFMKNEHPRASLKKTEFLWQWNNMLKLYLPRNTAVSSIFLTAVWFHLCVCVQGVCVWPWGNEVHSAVDCQASLLVILWNHLLPSLKIFTS